MSEPKPAPDTKALAEELAAHLGREQGGVLLERARAMAVLSNSRAGSSTTEFRMAALAILAGLVLVAIGGVQEQPLLIEQGLDLVRWSTVGYGVSRGLAKAGALREPKG